MPSQLTRGYPRQPRSPPGDRKALRQAEGAPTLGEGGRKGGGQQPPHRGPTPHPPPQIGAGHGCGGWEPRGRGARCGPQPPHRGNPSANKPAEPLGGGGDRHHTVLGNFQCPSIWHSSKEQEAFSTAASKHLGRPQAIQYFHRFSAKFPSQVFFPDGRPQVLANHLAGWHLGVSQLVTLLSPEPLIGPFFGR